MCWCTPSWRTPHCGKPTCVPPQTQTTGKPTMPSLVERLRQERRPTRWKRGVDTDYPVEWEPHPLCQEAADELQVLAAQRDSLRNALAKVLDARDEEVAELEARVLLLILRA